MGGKTLIIAHIKELMQKYSKVSLNVSNFKSTASAQHLIKSDS